MVASIGAQAETAVLRPFLPHNFRGVAAAPAAAVALTSTTDRISLRFRIYSRIAEIMCGPEMEEAPRGLSQGRRRVAILPQLRE